VTVEPADGEPELAHDVCDSDRRDAARAKEPGRDVEDPSASFCGVFA
jgi:hypothetical protein